LEAKGQKILQQISQLLGSNTNLKSKIDISDSFLLKVRETLTMEEISQMATEKARIAIDFWNSLPHTTIIGSIFDYMASGYHFAEDHPKIVAATIIVGLTSVLTRMGL
jgi:hypothetical protein